MSLDRQQTQANAPSVLNAGKRPFRKRLLIVAAWALAVLLFASQWYAYDAAHGLTAPFIFYVGWSCYLWGVLTPLSVWLAWRHPIGSGTWKRAIAFHLAISMLLTSVQLSIEAWIAVLRAGGDWPLLAAVRHYLTQHVQVGLMTFQGTFFSRYSLMMAATTITMGPALLLYAFFQKSIIKGVMAGAVRG